MYLNIQAFLHCDYFLASVEIVQVREFCYRRPVKTRCVESVFTCWGQMKMC